MKKISQPQQPATIKDIAKIADVSVMTVSRALNNSPLVTDETRDKIIKIAQELKYKVNMSAKSLVSQKKYSIEIIFSTMSSDTSSSFMATCLRGVYQKLAPDYNLVIKDLSNGYMHFNLSRVDGVILVSQQESDDDFIQFANSEGANLVVINRHSSVDNTINVAVNEVFGAKSAVDLLTKQFKNIALINGPDNIQSSIDRLAGYEESLKTANYQIKPELIEIGLFTSIGGYDAMVKLLALSTPPDAVFCANDEMAIGALKALREANLEGKIAVVGFNDSDISQYTTPALTTVRKPIGKMAELGTELLFNLIDKRLPEQQNYNLETELIIRDSAIVS